MWRCVLHGVFGIVGSRSCFFFFFIPSLKLGRGTMGLWVFGWTWGYGGSWVLGWMGGVGGWDGLDSGGVKRKMGVSPDRPILSHTH